MRSLSDPLDVMVLWEHMANVIPRQPSKYNKKKLTARTSSCVCIWKLLFQLRLMKFWRVLHNVKFGRTIISVSVVQQLLPLPLVLLGAPQLPCKQTASHTVTLTVEGNTFFTQFVYLGTSNLTRTVAP